MASPSARPRADGTILGAAVRLRGATDPVSFWSTLMAPLAVPPALPAPVSLAQLTRAALEDAFPEGNAWHDRPIRFYLDADHQEPHTGGTDPLAAALDQSLLETLLADALGAPCPVTRIPLGSDHLAALLTALDDLNANKTSIAIVAAIGMASDPRVASGVLLVCARKSDLVAQRDRPYATLIPDTTNIGYLELIGSPPLDHFGPAKPGAPRRPMGTLPPFEGPRAVNALASVLKVALCLSNKALPATHKPPTQAFDIPFYFNQSVRAWFQDPRSGLRRAALHDPSGQTLTFEEIPPDLSPRPVHAALPWDTELIVLSGATAAQLRDRARSLCHHAESLEVGFFPPLAFTLAKAFQSEHPYRLAIVCENPQQLIENLHIAIERLNSPSDAPFAPRPDLYLSCTPRTTPRKLAGIFPGLGPPGLVGPFGGQLHRYAIHFPEARAALDAVEGRDLHADDPFPTSDLLAPPDFLPEPERRKLHQRLASPLRKDAALAKNPRTRNYAPLVVLAANRACWAVLSRLGVRPDMVFGMSLGDVSAMCAAGHLPFEAINQMYWSVPENLYEFYSEGNLVMVFASEEVIDPYLKRYPNVSYAFYSSPKMHIMAGDDAEIQAMMSEMHQKEIFTHPAPYAAIHTPRFNFVKRLMLKTFGSTRLTRGTIPLYSGLLAGRIPNEPAEIMDLMIDNFSRPVRLWQTLKAMYDDGARCFVQMGGGAHVDEVVRTNLEKKVTALPLFADRVSETTQLNHVCATLLNLGHNLNLDYLFQFRRPPRLDLDLDAPPPREELEIPAPITAPPPRDANLPLIGEILSFQPDVSLSMRLTFDLAVDRHLSDHMFVHAPGVKPDASCLPVLPLTMGLEAMAEAAACLAPGMGLIGMEDVRAARWIALVDTDRLAVEIRATQVPSPHAARAIEAQIHVPGQEGPAMRCRLLFDTAYRPRLNLAYEEPTGIRPYPIPVDQIYPERHLFHGPLYQCITGVDFLADTALVGRMRLASPAGLFSHTTTPALLTDPVIMDGIGQLVGLWGIPTGRFVFPVAVAGIEFCCPTPPPGTTVIGYVKIVRSRSGTVLADIELQDGAGGVWIRVKGWQTWAYRWSPAWRDVGRLPHRHTLATRVSSDALPPGAVLTQANASDLPAMDLDPAPRLYLHPEELPTYRALGSDPEQQRDWFLRLVAAKDAIRVYLAQDIHPARIRLDSVATAHPTARIPGHSAPHLAVHSRPTSAQALATSAKIEHADLLLLAGAQ